MKVHSYTYRGKTVDVYKATVSDIENSLKDKNYLEFTDKGITTRLFDIKKDELFWHCVGSETDRISFGFSIV